MSRESDEAGIETPLWSAASIAVNPLSRVFVDSEFGENGAANDLVNSVRSANFVLLTRATPTPSALCSSPRSSSRMRSPNNPSRSPPRTFCGNSARAVFKASSESGSAPSGLVFALSAERISRGLRPFSKMAATTVIISPLRLVQHFQVAENLTYGQFLHLLRRPVEFFGEHEECAHERRLDHLPHIVLGRAQAADAVNRIHQEADQSAAHIGDLVLLELRLDDRLLDHQRRDERFVVFRRFGDQLHISHRQRSKLNLFSRPAVGGFSVERRAQ